MTDILAIDTHQAVLPTPGSPPAPGTAAWVTVRPHARRGAAVAADLLTAVQRPKRPALLRLGNGCRSLPLLAFLLPRTLLQAVLKKRFGLNRKLV